MDKLIKYIKVIGLSILLALGSLAIIGLTVDYAFSSGDCTVKDVEYGARWGDSCYGALVTCYEREVTGPCDEVLKD